jgi:hypothetical protein
MKAVTGCIFSDFDLANQKRGGSITGDSHSGVMGKGLNNLWAKTVTGTVHLKRRPSDADLIKIGHEELAAV